MGLRRAFHTVWPPLMLGAVLVTVWEYAARAGALPPFVLPAPSAVVGVAAESLPRLVPHVATTLTEAGLGLVAGVIAGGTLAIAMAALPWVARALGPFVTITQTVPVIVLAPLLALWLGLGLGPKVVVVALTVFFPVLVASIAAMRDADGDLADMVHGLGGTRGQSLWLVRVPAALPAALGGLRVAATYAIGAAVVSEYLAGSSGLGVVIQRARKSYDIESILVAIATVSLLTAVVYIIVDGVCRAALPWQRR